jgi:hypothetical protein
MFWTGMVLTPLAAAGMDSGDRDLPEYAGLDHVGRVLLLRGFPLAGRWKRPERVGPHLAKMAGVGIWAWFPARSTFAFNPDGIAHPDRWSTGPWLQALKYTPYRTWPALFRRDAGQCG